MTIRHVNEKNPVLESDVGKFACPESILYDGICTMPWEITKVAKSRVYLRKKRFDRRDGREDIEEKYVLSKTIRFVCDTEDEGERLVDISQEQMDVLRATRREVLDRYKTLIDDIVKESQESS